MAERPRLLVVDDAEEMTRLLEEELVDRGYEVRAASGGAEALALAQAAPPDVVITDLRMAPVDGFDLLEGLRSLDPDLPVIVMTAFGSIDTAVEAMRRGAHTYVTKPFRMDELTVHVDKALAGRALRRENVSLRRMVVADGPEGMIGRSPAMRALYQRVARLADASVPVLVRGESGTGKERVARALHYGGGRRSRSFVAVNCASVPATLLESELFGHVKGSFTGATAARRGLFVEADGGTLFLDEIGDMPLELQAHLLRVLEDGTVRPVGADTGRTVDVRVVAATHQPLEQKVAAGAFRADLYYRLDVVPLVLPPLRERIEDLPELYASFAARAGGSARHLSPEALAVLERHPWPGNVRELENLARRLAVLVDHDVVTEEDLEAHAPSLRRAELPRPLERARRELPTLREVQDDYIGFVVERCGGNKTRAAEILGIDVSTIHRRERVTKP